MLCACISDACAVEPRQRFVTERGKKKKKESQNLNSGCSAWVTSTGRHGSDGNRSSIPPSFTQLASIVQELLSASLKSSSVPTYHRAWKCFKEFQLGVFHSQNASLPIAPATLALFVAYLFANHYAISTINTYVSALGYYHRLVGLKDPTKTFYITETVKGYGRINCTLDSRLPITLPILVRFMQVSPSVCAS